MPLCGYILIRIYLNFVQVEEALESLTPSELGGSEKRTEREMDNTYYLTAPLDSKSQQGLCQETAYI